MEEGARCEAGGGTQEVERWLAKLSILKLCSHQWSSLRLAFRGRRYDYGINLMRYRADIDGMRAIAVAAVVLYHAFPTLLPGGFIGVDVFFVISGFLITNLIIGQAKEGKFSYLSFYKRRLLRLTPAFLVVALTSLGAAFFLYAPSEFEGLAKSLVAAVLLHANHHFYAAAGYFGAPVELTPMLHMWSLSVEEQFYLIFPVCLI